MNSNKKTVGIIGFGKVGGSLSFALSRNGFTVFVHTRTPPDKNITRHNFVASIHTLIEKASIIFITVPDSKIKNIARDIAGTRTSLKNKIIFHTSGSKTSQVLTIVRRKGASTASFHPLQTFPHIVDSLSIWKNIYCVLEGDKRAVATGKLLCKTLCMKSLVLPAKNKIYYHSAAVYASNFLILLIAMSQQLAEYAGINKKQFMLLFRPLILQSLDNILHKELSQALSGPLIRKDFDVIKAQIKAIKIKNRSSAKIYKLFVEYYEKYKKLSKTGSNH